ncbi:DUF72 domain-containing protein [Mucilaginibacter sp. HC2]|uniref:DUF72 domain-containing protein n=1 Tax=Mucilaginibacter inviolabilis TaxID=2714892 RepID=UPI00140C68D7|nr:DUF72 domain-containing protein [Mucilaginibacter inviolabilis]NHA02706.1 DUF72 domain-containing protein [Mucilaginibacter inviolabilis]
MKTSARQIFIGTSNLVLPVANKAAYPTEFQDQHRLVYYGHLFNSLEINGSFYKIPQANTLAKWASLVPDGFRFTFKLWKGITHEKDLAYEPSILQHFVTVINAVSDRRGALLVQFPPSIRSPQQLQLQRLLQDIHKAASGWDVAVEFRHASLYNSAMDQLLTDLNMAMVIHDLPASASPQEALPVPSVYVRFHGPESGYRGSYDDNYLQDYAERMKEWTCQGQRVYAYFNNTMGAAVQNLRTLNGLL